MQEIVKLLLGMVVLVMAGCAGSTPDWGPGVVVGQEPIQESTSRSNWERGGYTFKPRAEFEVRARILSLKWYGTSDPGSSFAPVDFALGWGPMSDDLVLEQLTIKQSGRWYHYRWEQSPPIPSRDIIRNSANMHLAPSDGWVEGVLREAQVGDVVRLRGVLVDVEGSGGRFRWKTSTTRKDTGQGACEIVWVEDVELEPAPRR